MRPSGVYARPVLADRAVLTAQAVLGGALILAACGGAPAGPAETRDPRIGHRVHITGCDNGELKVRMVNLWNTAARSAVVGTLSGDGQAALGFGCQGAVVIVRDVVGTALKVETVAGDQVGWVSEQFIGRRFDTSRCAEIFGYSAAARRKCESG
jgi:hypothetical protein